MVNVTVVVPSSRSLPRLRPVRYACWIATATGLKVEVPYAPTSVTLGGLGSSWDQVERVGRRPLVRFGAPQVPTASFTLTVARADRAPVDDVLKQLNQVAAGEHLVTVTGLSTLERGPWRVTGYDVDVTQRTPDNAGVERAEVSMGLTLAVDVTVAGAPKKPTKTGPLTGGVKNPPKVTPKATTRTHTVKKGETMWAIAGRYYGDPSAWTLIADANRKKVRNPSKITPGMVLVIPPKGG